MPQSQIAQPLTLSVRAFSVKELRLIQTLTIGCAALGRTELAYTSCQILDWRRPCGRLKNHERRLLVERLEAQGLVPSPSIRPSGRRGGFPLSSSSPTGRPRRARRAGRERR